jgi:hypothetical protein
MAEIRVYIQPRLPAASNQIAFYDFSKHIEFDSISWEQNDQGNASSLRANLYTILPSSTTHWLQYDGATQEDKIQNALSDHFFHLKIPSRTEIQIRDVSTNPHTILWGGVITRVSENRDGGAIVGSLEAIDYTAILNESVALEYTPLANSTIKQTITSQTYSFTPSLAERTAGLSTITISSITIGSPYSRNLEIGDTVVVALSDNTYDGVHKVTGVASEGSTHKIRFQQYSNVADSASAAVTGAVTIPGFMTVNNAPQLDSRIVVNAANIADLNPDYKWSPRNPDISRAVSNAARTSTTATITTSAPHGFGVDRVVTVSLTNGPSGYADLNGSFVIASVPTDSTFTYTTITSGTVTSGAATGTAVCSGEITPTPIKGGTLAQNLQYVVDRGSGVFYLDSGVLDGSNNLTINLNAKAKNLVDLVKNGLFDDVNGTTTTQAGWDMGLWLADITGTGGPYGVGNTLYYTGDDHQDAEMAVEHRVPVIPGEQYFVSWRHFSDKDAKERPRMKFYDASDVIVGNSHGIQINQHDPIDDEWHRDWGIVVVPAGAAKMSFTLHHEAHASSYTAQFTDIQIIKITGAYGFSDHAIEDTVTYGVALKDFENPSAPSESGESSNRLYLYAPYTTEDPLTGAKMLTSYRNTYDFVQGVWEAGGKRIESSKVSPNATDTETALLTAQDHFQTLGKTLKSFEFEHISGPLSVGDVVPFIWDELGIAEALVVRKQIGYLIGQQVYYRVQLGGDLSFQRSTMYLVEQRLREISGDAAYFSPPPSPYAGYPTEGGIVTPAVPSGDAGAEKVDISWEYPQSIVNSTSFGGFIVLRTGDAGTTWQKASTGEEILTAQNPLAPDTAVPSFTDTNVEASVGYVYKVAAVDVSGSSPILTQYSSDSEELTPTAPGGTDFADAYDGLGINVPKIVNSVTYLGNGVAKAISTITSGASTTATVTTSTAHGFSTGYVVGISGAAGTNNADVNGAFYIITVTTSTAFTITKTNSNVLSLTGGTANGWEVSGAFEDVDGNPRVLGDAFSIVQFPVGQLAYSEADGKLYRNGKHPSPGTGEAFDNYWTRASVDAIDVTSDGLVVISADKITTGTLNAGNVSVTNLNASNITTGTLTSIAINAGSGTFSVTSGGALTATSATISGAITATSGTIGGFLIGPSSLTAGSGVNSVGMAPGTFPFFAGNSAAASAPFRVSSSGSMTATGATLNNLIVDNSGSSPSLRVNQANEFGEIAVDTATAFRVGQWNPSTSQLTARFGFTNTGTFQIFNGTAGPTPGVAAQITSTGRATIAIQDGIDFFDGTTNRGRLRASTATSRLVSEVPFNVDGLLTVSTGGINVTGLATFVSGISVSGGTISAVGNISCGAIIQTTGSTNHFQYTEVPAATTASNPNSATGVMFVELVSGVYRFRRSTTASYASVKKNIEPAENYLTPQQFSALNFIRYQYDAEKLIAQFPIYDEVSERVQYGLAIEQLKEAIPSAVVAPDIETYPETIDWQQIYIAAMISLQDAVQRIEALEARIAELEA